MINDDEEKIMFTYDEFSNKRLVTNVEALAFRTSFDLWLVRAEIEKIKDHSIIEQLLVLLNTISTDLKKIDVMNDPSSPGYDEIMEKSLEERKALELTLKLKKEHYANAVVSSIRLGKEGMLNDVEKEAYLDLLKKAETSIGDPNSETLAEFEASRQKFETTVKDNKVVRHLSNNFVKAVVACILITSASIIGIFPTALLALCLAPTALKKIKSYNEGVENVLEKTNMSHTAKANKSYKGIFDEQKKKVDASPPEIKSIKHKTGGDLHARLLRQHEARKKR